VNLTTSYELFYVFIPVRTFNPFVVDSLIAAVIFNLPEKVIKPVEKIRISLSNRPCKRLKGKGFVKEDQFAGALLGIKHNAVGKIIDKCISLAVYNFKGCFRFCFKRFILAFWNKSFYSLFACSAELGCNGVFGIVQVFI